jgi:hypothetical protein
MGSLDEDIEVIADAGTKRRVRYCRRPDGLFTYYIEEERDGSPPGYEGSPEYLYWAELRYGGFFDREEDMRKAARAAPEWPLG